MRGQILDYVEATQSGIITGEDGARYTFSRSEWNDSSPPRNGLQIDFDVREGEAVAIYRIGQVATGAQGPGKPKSKVAAGLLAIFLGGLGIHKFYLGYNGAGIVHVVLVITFFFFWVSLLISLIEGIIYLTKSDEDFAESYVYGRKTWF